MSKVFFFSIPFCGHVNPGVGLARELVEKGEEVIYYCIESFREKIESSGAVFRSYGNKFYLNDDFVTHNNIEILRVHLELSEIIMEQLLNDIKRDKPDYIIHDFMSTWGKHAAQASNIPAVNIYTTLVERPEGFLKTAGLFLAVAFQILKNIPRMIDICKITRRLKKYNIKVKSLIDIIDNNEALSLVFTSRKFQPYAEKFGDEYKFTGPVSMHRNEKIKDFRVNRSAGRSLLFISLGTVFNNDRNFFTQCIKAFGNMDIDIFMSVGKKIDISSLTIPENFTVKYFFEIPQLEVLKECDVFITHGGMNSVHEGLMNGIPLIVVPQQLEQTHMAKRVAETGSGIYLDMSEVTPESLKKSYKKIISDGSYSKNAEKMKNSFLNAGGPKRAVEEIFSYIKEN
ncbi:macrolide family glycosyltransferase [Ruminiclostridium cellulolyticum]|uniref:Glycosyltransferase, MGT family n=1 Tax=Ruminiclostridium cellulolyticum (strain ATCC 35319 / DSM 5812 / JCM 6584 / H10) TaxID=394503 RepID=B8I5C7_RUMCH|nr:macrolide family glycosyltransferase [Ruminiclostridium cellulolyticum]ACL76663.1 glycosyltransferase, MGT family [Ruminiclostridium cellulolyticum H10]